MKTHLHRIVTIVLMLAIGIGVLSSVLLDIAKIRCEFSAKSSLASKADLHLLTIPVKDFKQRADKDEVWDHGNLYDISSYIVIDDNACVWVYHDQKEERIVNIIIGNNEQFDQNTSNNVRHISQYHSPMPDSKILVRPYVINFVRTASNEHFTASTFEYSSAEYSSVIKPPPRSIIG